MVLWVISDAKWAIFTTDFPLRALISSLTLNSITLKIVLYRRHLKNTICKSEKKIRKRFIITFAYFILFSVHLQRDNLYDEVCSNLDKVIYRFFGPIAEVRFNFITERIRIWDSFNQNIMESIYIAA